MNRAIENAWLLAVVIAIPLTMIILTHIAAVNQVVRDFHNKKLFLFTHQPYIHPVQPNKLICPHCGKLNPIDHSYCGFCGAPLKNTIHGGN